MADNDIINAQKELSSLNKKLSDLNTKETKASEKAHKATEVAQKTSSASTFKSKVREAENASKEIAKIQKLKSEALKKISVQTTKLHKYQAIKLKDDKKEQEKVAKEQTRLINERKNHMRDMGAMLTATAALPSLLTDVIPPYDFFVSHASEDKELFVRELASGLKEKGALVWYDEFTLKVGDSLRQNIDNGLKNSKFGIVILSEHFFKKVWTNRELDGLTTLEVNGSVRILPIWHKVSKNEVARYSPTLADKVALNTGIMTVEEIVLDLMELLK